MSRDKIQEDVKLFVSNFNNLPIEDISLGTTLGDDLGIDGDDAYCFFEEFAEHYDVDLSQFALDQHFGSECCCPLLWPYYIAMWIARHIAPPEYHARLGGLEPVTIKDLIQTVRAGNWHNRKKSAEGR